MASPSFAENCDINQRRQAAMEKDARLAYSVYAHRAGLAIAWENLEPNQRYGWKEAIECLQAEPECRICGSSLICPECDEDEEAKHPDKEAISWIMDRSWRPPRARGFREAAAVQFHETPSGKAETGTQGGQE